jgi:hypothetical protein
VQGGFEKASYGWSNSYIQEQALKKRRSVVIVQIF